VSVAHSILIIRSVQKFLSIQIFCNCCYYNKKIDTVEIIEKNRIFSIVFHDFFPFFRNLFFSTAAMRPERSLYVRRYQNHCLNQFANFLMAYNIFTIRLTNNSVCISSTFLLIKTKQKTMTFFLHF